MASFRSMGSGFVGGQVPLIAVPWKPLANRGVALLLVALALAAALAPDEVPGLTVPSSETSGMRMGG
jgi:hypothetical protein